MKASKELLDRLDDDRFAKRTASYAEPVHAGDPDYAPVPIREIAARLPAQ
jgi:hypothetical protein